MDERDWQEESGHVGEIVSVAKASPITCEAWIALIDAHPNLARPQGVRVVPNPFKPGTSMEVRRGAPDCAKVTVDGSEVGSMTWAEDDSDLINVWGDSSFPCAVAVDVASRLGGRFIVARWVSR